MNHLVTLMKVCGSALSILNSDRYINSFSLYQLGKMLFLEMVWYTVKTTLLLKLTSVIFQRYVNNTNCTRKHIN